jgi:hypothetical protein
MSALASAIRTSFAVSYKAGSNDTGLALYGAEGDDWQGVWTYSNARQIGTQVCTRE